MPGDFALRRPHAPRQLAQVVLVVGQVQDPALAEHDVVVELLAQTLPELQRELHEIGVGRQKIVGAHDGGVAAGVAAAQPAALDHRDVGDAVLLGQIVGGRQAVAAADDVASTALGRGAGVIALDIEVTPELEREGRARDLVRIIQQARRDAQLDVSDRIAVDVCGGPAWVDAIDAHRQLIAGETLAVTLEGRVDETADDGADPVVVVARRATT